MTCTTPQHREIVRLADGLALRRGHRPGSTSAGHPSGSSPQRRQQNP
jgi:hypothetical protein